MVLCLQYFLRHDKERQTPEYSGAPLALVSTSRLLKGQAFRFRMVSSWRVVVGEFWVPASYFSSEIGYKLSLMEKTLKPSVLPKSTNFDDYEFEWQGWPDAEDASDGADFIVLDY